jgi:hypothetical protein
MAEMRQKERTGRESFMAICDVKEAGPRFKQFAVKTKPEAAS